MTKKLDKEHVEAIQKLQDDFAKNATMLGRIAIDLKIIEQQKQELLETQTTLFGEFEKLRQEESELIEKLKERYGDGQINIVDGTFTSAE